MQLSFELSTSKIEVKESIYPNSAAICVDGAPRIFLNKEQARNLTAQLINNDKDYWVETMTEAILEKFRESNGL